MIHLMTPLQVVYEECQVGEEGCEEYEEHDEL